MTIDPRAYERRWKTLAVLAISLFIVGIDNTILNVALPTLERSLDASPARLQWMVDAYLLVFGAFLLTAGTLADRIGRKRMLQAGIVVFGTASLLAGLSATANQLIACRAVMGLGAALIMPATLSTITAVFPRDERGKAIGIWAGIAAVGIGLGPLVGGLLLRWFDWGSVFFVNVPIAVVALLAGIALVPESRDPNPGTVRPARRRPLLHRDDRPDRRDHRGSDARMARRAGARRLRGGRRPVGRLHRVGDARARSHAGPRIPPRAPVQRELARRRRVGLRPDGRHVRPDALPPGDQGLLGARGRIRHDADRRGNHHRRGSKRRPGAPRGRRARRSPSASR